MSDENHFDVIIVGTGAGGGTLTHRLAQSGKRILVLERGKFLPREKANWDTVQVFQRDRYHTDEIWYANDTTQLRPGVGYWVGGNTKVYGAALFRLRKRDFERVVHKGGISPEWPLKYGDFAPYYARAERLYNVHGKRGLDPTEPEMAEEYPFPAVQHEPRIQEVHDALQQKDLHPFYVPLAIKLDEADRTNSACIRCDTCDGFPCLVHAKGDADVNCVRPASAIPNVTLMTEAKVTRLHTGPSGLEVTGVETQVRGRNHLFSADIVVVSCGAINSAVLLLRSANHRHPNGLANSSGQVGRNFMKHQNGALVAVAKKLNPTIFQKTLAINDFYWGDEVFEYPMGHVQLMGKVNKDMLGMDAPAFAPGMALAQMARHSVDWWLTSEDLPDPDNRVSVVNDRITLRYKDNNVEAYDRLVRRWSEVLKSIDCGERIIPCSFYFRKKIPLQGVAHQVGTCRFGEDPSATVLDIHCKAHGLDNLYVVDGSFFPSSGAVNPALTIAANALRVGDHLIDRMG
ncbi:MAG: GMC family oxidoreductase [Chloroflexi bacterium]|nr:GMC family oxidoreductase [Chloroflexota bacterium]